MLENQGPWQNLYPIRVIASTPVASLLRVSGCRHGLHACLSRVMSIDTFESTTRAAAQPVSPRSPHLRPQAKAVIHHVHEPALAGRHNIRSKPGTRQHHGQTLPWICHSSADGGRVYARRSVKNTAKVEIIGSERVFRTVGEMDR